MKRNQTDDISKKEYQTN